MSVMSEFRGAARLELRPNNHQEHEKLKPLGQLSLV